ncbi:hypothetical protein [Tenacibaculum discolor]|uniref:hypothetical protein n=1 Tax=Tenacibaculum discolor TaxID=361581 RepID=UPI000EB1EF1D|nr:hypothetical protein [Tenacibaculum discolor]RLK02160.1 hypothetical protein C8N27_1293 [Tenacibaculum discolor]
MKKTLIISYDLKNASDDQYEELYQFFKDYGTWAHITESTWAIVTEEKTTEVRDKISDIVPSGSSIFVIKSGSIAAWQNVICRNEWLKKNL